MGTLVLNQLGAGSTFGNFYGRRKYFFVKSFETDM